MLLWIFRVGCGVGPGDLRDEVRQAFSERVQVHGERENVFERKICVTPFDAGNRIRVMWYGRRDTVLLLCVFLQSARYSSPDVVFTDVYVPTAQALLTYTLFCDCGARLLLYRILFLFLRRSGVLYF